jgi:hypothetical protein
MRRTLEMILLISLSCVVLSAPVFGQRYTFFPHLASGGGWTSELRFANQGISDVMGIKITFYNSDGSLLMVESNLGAGTDISFSLPKGANQMIRISPHSTPVSGYAVITYPSEVSPVRATEIYRYAQRDTVLAEVGVAQQEAGSHFSFPVEIDSNTRINTAVGLLNPAVLGAGAQTIVLNLIKPDGNIQATATKVLQPGEHYAGYLNDATANLFPGLNSFTGVLSVSSPLGAAVVALRQDADAFGGISTDSGPLMGPFLLSGGTVFYSLEPNDNFVQAQTISGSKIISGTIGTLGDADIYKFTGRKGDLISVLCAAQSNGSDLDSVLEIYSNSDLKKPIAYNDQNGLAPQGDPLNDSFIQMALPENNTYFIKVYDYWHDGGSSYIYTLHVKLP